MKERGSALLYVVLALAAVGGLSVVYLRESDSTFSKIKNQAIERDADDLTAQLQRMLSHRPTCFNTFKNMNAAGANVTAIKNSADNTVIDGSTVFGRSGLRIDSMELRDYPGNSDGVQVLANGLGSTHLLIKFKEVKNTAYANRNLQRRVKLMVNQVTSSINQCWAVSSGVDSIWQLQAGTENIYYTLGNVGVRDAPPQEKLHVSGNIRAENASGEGLNFGGNGSDLGFDLKVDRPLRITNSAGSLRDIRVRNAEGAETIQLSGAPSSCNATTLGSIRYHKLSRTLQACSGGYWKTIQSNVLIMYP